MIGELKGHTRFCELFSLFFMSDEKKLISASSDGSVRVWNLDTFT